MKKYTNPDVSVIYFESSDIISLSEILNGTDEKDILSLELGVH